MMWRWVVETWPGVLATDLARYVLTAGAFYLVFWVWWAGRWAHRRIQARRPLWSQIRREVAYSLSTVVIFSAVGLWALHAILAGRTRVYHDVSARGWPYLLLSLVLMALLHDAYFYWTHRLMHTRSLYGRVHRVHHLSRTPTPWAAYAFHPLEALVQAGIYPLLVLAVPAHPLALWLFLLYMIVRNVAGHLGIEPLPRGFATNPLTRWHTTSTHHDLHHRYVRGNYGLYFTWWDRLMGTTHPRYGAVFEGITSPVGAGSSAQAAPKVT